MVGLSDRNILIVDGDVPLRGALAEHARERGAVVHEAASAAHAFRAVPEGLELDGALVADSLPDGSGLEVVRRLRRTHPTCAVVAVMHAPTMRAAVEAMKHGAADCASCSLAPSSLMETLELALQQSQEEPPASAPRDVGAGHPAGGQPSDLLGTSRALDEVRARLDRLARSQAGTVLLTGESGTGKSVAARFLHQHSTRAAHPFLVVACSALPEHLVAGELFGQDAPAYAAPTRAKVGLIELAAGGTLFLDEVADLTPMVQASLLQFLEDRTFRRIGGDRDIRADVRVVAATHRDLAEEAAAGRFRSDLHYLLRAAPVHLPPLRERREDVAPLARYFVAELAQALGRPVRGLAPAALQRLATHDWPGNVRELKCTLERAVLLSEGEWLTAADCAPAPRQDSQVTFRLPPEGLVLEKLERSLLLQALRATEWNQVRAGRLLGLNRDQVRYRIEKFHLTPDSDEDAA